MKKLEGLYQYLREEGLHKEARLLFSFLKTAKTYTIKSGDTAWSISGGNPVYQRMIENANPDLDWTKLQIGQIIEVPDPNAEAAYDQEGANMIKKFEGLRLESYDDGGWWAIGYGHRHGKVGQTSPMRITKSQADQYLTKDMDKVLGFIKRNVTTPLNTNQVNALVSIIYNTGVGTISRSKLLKLINSGDLTGAGNLIPVAFVSSPGHQKRRAAEAAMWKGGTG